MRLKNIRGIYKYKNCNKYRVNWDKPCLSKFQFDVKQFLRKYISNHVVFEEFPVYGSKMHVDLFDATSFVVYETQGQQHDTYNKFFHGNRVGLGRQIKRDSAKYDWCVANEITYVEIYPEDMPLNTEFFKKYGVTLL